MPTMLSWGNETSFSSLFVHHSWHSYMHSHHHCYLIVSEYVTNIFWSRAPSKPAASLQPKKGDILKDGSEERKEVSGVLQPTPKELLDHQLEPMRYFHFVQRLQYVIYVTFIWMQASSRPPVVLHPMSISSFCNSLTCFRVKARMQKEAADASNPGKSGIGSSRKTPQDAKFFPTRYPSIWQFLALIICWRCMYLINICVVFCFLLICSWWNISGWNNKKSQLVLFPKPTVEEGWNQNPFQRLGLHFTTCKQQSECFTFGFG